MIVALLVAFMVLILSIYVVNLTLHSTTTSAYDRKRVTSVMAAEAGIDAFWNMVQFTAPENLPCATPTAGRINPVAGSLDVVPGTSTYAVTVTYYDADGQPIRCTDLAQSLSPAAVLATSTGKTSGSVPRTMQSYMRLAPTRSGGFRAAVIAENGLSISGNGGVDGDQTVIDADLYVNNGNLSLSGQVDVQGDVYVHAGAASLAGSVHVFGDVWAWNSATIDNPALIDRNLTSSQGALGVVSNSGGSVGACATAATTIDPKIRIRSVPRCVRPNNASNVAPPSVPLPHVCWDPVVGVECQGTSDVWVAKGYTIVDAPSCSAAQGFIATGTAISHIRGDVLLRVTGCANLDISSRNVYFDGNLAIFSDGAITLGNQNNFYGVAGKSIFFIVGYRSGMSGNLQTCPASPGPYDVTFLQNPNFRNVSVTIYTPFNANIQNNSATPQVVGQILGGTVCTGNKTSIKFKPVPIPGVSPISGFDQDIVYLREVAPVASPTS